MLEGIVLKSVLAGLAASLACGLGVLPLFISRIDPSKRAGLGYAFAAGLMLSASVYNLILPSLTMNSHGLTWAHAWPVALGILLGAGFIGILDNVFDEDQFGGIAAFKNGGKRSALIFVAMFIHSIPEGVAIGVGYTSEPFTHQELGTYLAFAIGIHNIPEGLAVAIPLRAGGASLATCFWLAVLTSLPQPIASIPACLASWFFQPLMPFLMSFAAGAMIFLIVTELIPAAMKTETCSRTAWALVIGFVMMLLLQVAL